MNSRRIPSSDADGSVVVHSDDEGSIIERDVPHVPISLVGPSRYPSSLPSDLHRGAGGRGVAGLSRVWETRHAAAADGQPSRLAALPPLHGAEWAPPGQRQHRSADAAGGARGGSGGGAVNLGDSIDGFPMYVDEDGAMRMHAPRRRGPFDFAYGGADDEAVHMLGGAGGGGAAGRGGGGAGQGRGYGGGADDVVMDSSATSSGGSVLSGSSRSSSSPVSYSSYEDMYHQRRRTSRQGYHPYTPPHPQQPHNVHGNDYDRTSPGMYYPADWSGAYGGDGGDSGLFGIGAGLPGRPHVASRRRRLVGVGATTGTAAAGASAHGRRRKGWRWRAGRRRSAKRPGGGRAGGGAGGTALVKRSVVTGSPFASGVYSEASRTSHPVGHHPTRGPFPYNASPLARMLWGEAAAPAAMMSAAVAAFPGGPNAFLLLCVGIPHSVGPSEVEKTARTRAYLLARQAELERRDEARRRTGATDKEEARRASPSSALASTRLAESGTIADANTTAATLPVSLEDLSRSIGGQFAGSGTPGLTLTLSTACSARSRGREAPTTAGALVSSRAGLLYPRADPALARNAQDVGAAGSAVMTMEQKEEEEEQPAAVLRDPYTGRAVSLAFVKASRATLGGVAASGAAASAPHTCSAGIHFFRDPTVPRPSVLALMAPSITLPLSSIAYTHGASQAVSEGNSLGASLCSPHTPPLLSNAAVATAQAAAASYQLPSSLQLYASPLLPTMPLPTALREGSTGSRSGRTTSGSRDAVVSARLGASYATTSGVQDAARHPRTETAAFRDGRAGLTARDTGGVLLSPVLVNGSAPTLGSFGLGGAARSRWRLQQGSAGGGAPVVSPTSPQAAVSAGGRPPPALPLHAPSAVAGVDMSASISGSTTMPSSAVLPRVAVSLPAGPVQLPAYPPAIAPYAVPRPPQLQNTRYHAWTAEGVSTTSNTPCVVHVFTVSLAMLHSVYEHVAYMCAAKRQAELQRRQRRREERAAAGLVAGRLGHDVQRCLRCPHCGVAGQLVARQSSPRRGNTAPVVPPLDSPSPATPAVAAVAGTPHPQPPHRYGRIHSQPHPQPQLHTQRRRHSEHHLRASQRLSSTATLSSLPPQPLRGSASAPSLSTEAPAATQQHTERLGWPSALPTTDGASTQSRTSLLPQAPLRSTLAMSSASSGAAGALGAEARTEDCSPVTGSWSRAGMRRAGSTASLVGVAGVSPQVPGDTPAAGGSALGHAAFLPHTNAVEPVNSSFAEERQGYPGSEPGGAAMALVSPPTGSFLKTATASRAPPLVTGSAAGQLTSPALPPLARSCLPPALRTLTAGVQQQQQQQPVRAEEVLSQELQDPLAESTFQFPSVGEAAVSSLTTAPATPPKRRRRLRPLGASTADAAALISVAGATHGGCDSGEGSGEGLLESPVRSTEVIRSLPMSSLVRGSASQVALDRYANASGTDVHATRRHTATAANTTVLRSADVLSSVDDAVVTGSRTVSRRADEVAGGDDTVDCSLPRSREALRRSSSSSIGPRGGLGGPLASGSVGSDVDEWRRDRTGSVVGLNSTSTTSQQQLPQNTVLGDSFADLLTPPPSLPIAISTTTSPDRSTLMMTAAARRDAASATAAVAASAPGHTGTGGPPASFPVARRASSVATAGPTTGPLLVVPPTGSSPTMPTRGVGNSTRSTPNVLSSGNSLFCSVSAAALTPVVPPVAQSGKLLHADRDSTDGADAVEGAAGDVQGGTEEAGRDAGDGIYVCLGCHREVASRRGIPVSLGDPQYHHALQHHTSHGPWSSPKAATEHYGAGDGNGAEGADHAGIAVMAFEDLLQDDVMVHALHTCLRDALMLPDTRGPPPAPSPLRRWSSFLMGPKERQQRDTQPRASSVMMPVDFHELLRPVTATGPSAAEPHAKRACSSVPPPEPHPTVVNGDKARTDATVPEVERGTPSTREAAESEGGDITAAVRDGVPQFRLSISGGSSTSSNATSSDDEDASSSTSSSAPSSSSPTPSTTASSIASAPVAAASKGMRSHKGRSRGGGDSGHHCINGSSDGAAGSGGLQSAVTGVSDPLFRLSLPCCGVTVTALPYVAPSLRPPAGWTRAGGPRDGRDAAAGAQDTAHICKQRGSSQTLDGGGANAVFGRLGRRRSVSTALRNLSPVPRMREDAATRGLTPSAVLVSDAAPQRRRRSSAGVSQGSAGRDRDGNQPSLQRSRRGLADQATALPHPASDAILQHQTAATIALMTKSTFSSEKHRIQVNSRTPLDAVSKNRIMDRIFRQDRLDGMPATKTAAAAAGASAATAPPPSGARHVGPEPSREPSAAGVPPSATAAAGASRQGQPGSLSHVDPTAGDGSVGLLAGRHPRASFTALHGGHDRALRSSSPHAHAAALRLLPPHRTPAPLGLDLGAYEEASLVLEIDLAYPRVPGGNVRELLAEWKETYRPHPVLVETVLRNVVYAVLVQLADLHATGRTHGSVKSTNVFPLWNAVEGTRQAGVVLPPRQRRRPAPFAPTPPSAVLLLHGRTASASETPDMNDSRRQASRLSTVQVAWDEASSKQPAAASVNVVTADDTKALVTPTDRHTSTALPDGAANTQTPTAAVVTAKPAAGSSTRKHRQQTRSVARQRGTGTTVTHTRLHQDARSEARKSPRALKTSHRSSFHGTAAASLPRARSGVTATSRSSVSAAAASPLAGACTASTSSTTGLSTAMAAFRRGNAVAAAASAREGRGLRAWSAPSAAAGAPAAAPRSRTPRARLMSISSARSFTGMHLPEVGTPVAELQPSLLTSDSLVLRRGAPSENYRDSFSPAIGLSSSNRRYRRGSGASVFGTASITAVMGFRIGGGAGGRRRMRRGSLGTNTGAESRAGDHSDDSIADEDAALVPLVAEVLTPPGSLPRRRSGAARKLAMPLGVCAAPSAPAAEAQTRASHRHGRRTWVPAGLKDPDEWLAEAVRLRYARGVQLRTAGAVWFPATGCGDDATDAGGAATAGEEESDPASVPAAAPAQPVLTTGPAGPVPGPRPECCAEADDVARAPTDPLQWSRQVLLVENVSAVVAAALRTAMTCVLTQHPPRPAPAPSPSPAAAAPKKGRSSGSVRHRSPPAHPPAAPLLNAYTPDVQHASPPPPPCLFDVQESEYVPPPEQMRTGTDEARALRRLWQQQRPEEVVSSSNGVRNAGAGTTGDDGWLMHDDITVPPATTLRNTLDPYPVHTAAADIWALGMMALELADGPAPTTWLKQRDIAPALRPYPWSSFFHAFVTRCVQPAPEQRATAAELLDHPWFGVALMPQAASAPAPLDGMNGRRHGSTAGAPAAAAAAESPSRGPGVMGVDSLTAEEKAEWEGYDYTQLYAAATHAPRPRASSAVVAAAVAGSGANTPSLATIGDGGAGAAGGRGVHGRVQVTAVSVTSADTQTSGGVGASTATEHGHAAAGDAQSMVTVHNRSGEGMSSSHSAAGGGAGLLPSALMSVADGAGGRAAAAGAGSGSAAPSTSTAAAHDDSDIMAELCAVDMAQHFAEQVTAQWVRQHQRFVPSLAAAAGSLPLFAAAAQRDLAAASDGATSLMPAITSPRPIGGVGAMLSPRHGTAPPHQKQPSDCFTPRGIREEKPVPLYANHSITFSNNTSMTSQALLSHLKSTGPQTSSPLPGLPSELIGRGASTWTGVPSSMLPTLYVPLRDPRDDAGVAHQLSGASTPHRGGTSGTPSPWLPRGANDWGGSFSQSQSQASTAAVQRGAAAAAAAAGDGGSVGTATFPVLERDGGRASSTGSEVMWAERVAGMRCGGHPLRRRSSGSCPRGKEDSTDTGSAFGSSSSRSSSSGSDDTIFSTTSSSSHSAMVSVVPSTPMANMRGDRGHRQRGTALPGVHGTSETSLSSTGGPAMTGGEVPDPTRTRANHISEVVSVTSTPPHDSDGMSRSSAVFFKIQTPKHSRGEGSLPHGLSPPHTGATRPRARRVSRLSWRDDDASGGGVHGVAVMTPLSSSPHRGRRHLLLGTIATSLARLSTMVHPHVFAAAGGWSDSGSSDSDSTDTTFTTTHSSSDDDEEYIRDTETGSPLTQRRSSWRRMSHQESDATRAHADISDGGAAANENDLTDGAEAPRMSAEARCDEILCCFTALQRTCPAAVRLWCARVLQQAARKPRTAVTAKRLLERVEQALPAERERQLAWLTTPDGASPSLGLLSRASAAVASADAASPTSPAAAVPSFPPRPSTALMTLPPPELDTSPSSFHHYENAKWLYALHRTLPRCT